MKESKCIEEFYDISLPIPAEPYPTVGGNVPELAAPQTTSSWMWNRAKSLLGISESSRVSLQDCLLHFMKSEKLSEMNAYFCEHCKKKNDSLKRMSIHKSPEVLVLHLKRFRHDGGYYGGAKISKHVSRRRFHIIRVGDKFGGSVENAAQRCDAGRVRGA